MRVLRTLTLPEAVAREWEGHVDPRILKLDTHVAPVIPPMWLPDLIALVEALFAP